MANPKLPCQFVSTTSWFFVRTLCAIDSLWMYPFNKIARNELMERNNWPQGLWIQKLGLQGFSVGFDNPQVNTLSPPRTQHSWTFTLCGLENTNMSKSFFFIILNLLYMQRFIDITWVLNICILILCNFTLFSMC